MAYLLNLLHAQGVRASTDPVWIGGQPGNFPPVTRLAGVAAVTSTLTAGAATKDEISYASFAGMPYNLVPMFIESNQSFICQMNWIAAVPLPSGVIGRIFVRLRGRLIRDAQ